MKFLQFRDRMQGHADRVMEQPALFLTSVSGDEMWETYLDSFPPGTNEIHKERRSHDCSCCKSFVRAFGNVVAIMDNDLVSFWDLGDAGDIYQPVVDAMSALVKSRPIVDAFVTKESGFGTDQNKAQLEDGSVITWHHFRADLPARLVTRSSKSEASLRGEIRTSHDVFSRSLNELSPDAVEIVLDLIAENTLYRGEEWRGVLGEFASLQDEYHALPDDQKDNYCWSKSVEVGGAITRIRNHSIGVLLQDIAGGMDVLDAVKRYESIVAPHNYKRPKAIFTKKMVEDAQRAIEELGLLDSLGRRHARLSDVTVNNVLFADRDARPHMDGAGSIFEVLKSEVAVKPGQFKNVQGVGVEQFLADVLPTATRLEVLFENRHQPNLVSLIAPTVADSPTLFKWDNSFSWAYNGNIADSAMKQRIKAAGGDVGGVLRFSLQWNEGFDNRNDFDAHCIEPGGTHIFWPNAGRRWPSTGVLDVDIIHPRPDQVAVENITWSHLDRMPRGMYKLFVHNYQHRGGRSGFSAEIEYGGEIREYEYAKELAHNENVLVAEVRLKEDGAIEFIKSLPSTTSTKEVWGLNTNQWQRASLLAFSPNHWNGRGVGHRHYLFLLVGCMNDERPNGFFNEYLQEEFMEQKRVFAALGNKMRVGQADEQLSGLGFSSTRHNSLVVRVDGQVTKLVF